MTAKKAGEGCGKVIGRLTGDFGIVCAGGWALMAGLPALGVRPGFWACTALTGAGAAAVRAGVTTVTGWQR